MLVGRTLYVRKVTLLLEVVTTRLLGNTLLNLHLYLFGALPRASPLNPLPMMRPTRGRVEWIKQAIHAFVETCPGDDALSYIS